MHKPQQKVLWIWRLILILITIVPAFANSLVFEVGSGIWLLITAVWVAAFLFFYLLYLPARYRRMRYTIREDCIEVHSGVFNSHMRIMPMSSIQYTTLLITPFDALWGLATLVVNAPGGRISLPGLRRSDAEKLAAILPGRWTS